ncbi:hypothetical protein DFH09DRAFT_179185, partial [Mycena vulgaris]
MPVAVDSHETVQNAGKRPSPTLPAELHDRIIELALEFRNVHPTSLGSNFEVIASLMLVSIQFRAFALRHYFRHIILPESSGKKQSPWNGLCSLEERTGECFTWVRSLRASSTTLTFHSAQRLAALTHLQELSVDLRTEGLFTQQPVLKRICRDLLSSSTHNASHTLTMLTLTSLPRIDIPLLRLIAISFPRLFDLHLGCTERLDLHCCWSCYEESLGVTIHSPVPDMFSRSRDMAVAFASILQPLKLLTHLHLGVYLSDEMLLHVHLDHGQAEIEFPFGPEQCLLCEEAATEVRLRELAAGLELAQHLKALRTVGFSSFFNDVAGYYSSGGRWPDKTMVYVLRENGRIRVRKTAWPEA